MKMSKRALKKFLLRRAVSKVQSLETVPSRSPSRSTDSVKTVEPKGMPGGRCNVTACQKPNSAICLNVGQIGGKHPDTGGCYYCIECAYKIHKSNERYSKTDRMTMFPALDLVNKRYREIFRARDGRKVNDFENYRDIDQNPWGSCHHRDRDKYLSSHVEFTNAGPRGVSHESITEA